MKIHISYESDTLLPKELENKFYICLDRIKSNRYEDDKIVCNIMNLKGEVIKWLANNNK